MAAGRVLTPPLDVTEAFVIKVFLRCTDFPARVPLTGLFIPKPFTADQAASVIPAFLAVWCPPSKQGRRHADVMPTICQRQADVSLWSQHNVMLMSAAD